MLKSFRYRLYPSKPQERLLEHTLETCRRWYNQCLAERRDAYQERGETIGKFQQFARVKELKASNPYATGIHSHVLQVVVADLDKAFAAFFRRVKGSASRRKAVRMLQRQHERVANQRKDFLNKLAHGLIARYDRIALEDLRITNLVRNRHLAKSILDAGWGYLVQHLTSKAEEAGRVVLLVDPRNTSKTCGQCGHVFQEQTLADRWVDCACGLSLDRDHNAAINILNRAGQVRWASSSPVGGLAQEAARL